ncbi:MAG: DUF4294 domain-containing protein [Bacteroidales bacterium]|nr:DUF4294 domain-containing protein [Bacteroidales bacterium]
MKRFYLRIIPLLVMLLAGYVSEAQLFKVSKSKDLKVSANVTPIQISNSATIIGQPDSRDNKLVMAVVFEGDTIPYIILKTVMITGSSSLLTPEEIRKNKKLIVNVKKMLPYAKLARQELDKVEKEAGNLPSKDRKEYIKNMEKEMLAQYTEELKKFTISQGKVLLKLVDRETSRTSYVIAKELRGKFRAGFYQTFARLFGYNLKDHYDPRHNKEDNLIERIVLTVEAGKI